MWAPLAWGDYFRATWIGLDYFWTTWGGALLGALRGELFGVASYLSRYSGHYLGNYLGCGSSCRLLCPSTCCCLLNPNAANPNPILTCVRAQLQLHYP